jgi:hypothetical protein
MNVLVATGAPELQGEVTAGLRVAGFSVVEAGRAEIAFGDMDALVPPGVLRAAVLGYGFGFDGLAFGAFLRERHPRLGVVYVVRDPWMSGRTRALDHRCERTVLSPLPGQRFCMALLARVLGEVAGPANGALSTRAARCRTEP